MILLDTNIFIEILLGTPEGQEAVKTIEAIGDSEPMAYSVLTWFELCAKESQREAAREFLKGFQAVPLTLAMTEAASDIFNRCLSKNRRKIPDALIASTALITGASLWTLNRSDFERVPHLKLFQG